MAPYREQARAEDLPPELASPARLVAHGFDHRYHRVLCRTQEGTEHVLVDRRAGTHSARAWLPVRTDCPAVCAPEGFLAWEPDATEGLQLTSARALEGYRWVPPGELNVAPASVQAAPFVLEDRPHLLLAHYHASPGAAGPRMYALGDPAASLVPKPWEAPANARALLCAAVTVYGPVAVFATDRADELELSRPHTPGSEASEALWSRTVSLGPGQRFVAAAGGGRQIAVVSGNERGFHVRTLASDLRSELNSVPLPHRTGWQASRVLLTNALGPFVLLYEEESDGEVQSQLLLFDGYELQAQPLGPVRYEGLSTKGREVCLVRMVGAASAPEVELTALRATMDHKTKRWSLEGLGTPFDTRAPRTSRYPLTAAPLKSSEQRRALLGDLCRAMCASLGVGAPRELHFEERGPSADVALFRVLGDAAQFGFAVLARADGTGVLTLRVGEGEVPEPRALGWLEVLRKALTGDDDGDPHTEREPLGTLWAAVEQVRKLVARALGVDLAFLDGALPED